MQSGNIRKQILQTKRDIFIMTKGLGEEEDIKNISVGSLKKRNFHDI